MIQGYKLGRGAAHFLLAIYAITLGYVISGLVLDYEVSLDVFFGLSFVLLFFVLAQSIYEMGIRHAVLFLIITTAIGLLFEVIGTNTGIPFGKYYYTNILGALILNVPVVVPLLWFVITYITFSQSFLYFGERTFSDGRIIFLVALASFGAMAWDLMVDPMFTSYGYWVWEAGSSPTLSGVPLTNFAGWFVVAFTMIIGFVFATKKKKVIIRINTIDSRIVYILLLIDAIVANGSLSHYLVIALGAGAMVAFFLSSHFVARAEKKRLSKIDQIGKKI